MNQGNNFNITQDGVRFLFEPNPNLQYIDLILAAVKKGETDSVSKWIISDTKYFVQAISSGAPQPPLADNEKVIVRIHTFSTRCRPESKKPKITISEFEIMQRNVIFEQSIDKVENAPYSAITQTNLNTSFNRGNVGNPQQPVYQQPQQQMYQQPQQQQQRQQYQAPQQSYQPPQQQQQQQYQPPQNQYQPPKQQYQAPAPAPTPYQKPASTYNSGFGGSSTNTGDVYTIHQVSKYVKRFSLKVKITKLKDVRTYSNAKGEGKILAFDCADTTGEIKVTMFNDSVDKYQPILSQGQVYLIKDPEVKDANTKFNNLNNHFELTVGRTTEIIPDVDDGSISGPKFKFIPIQKLSEYAANQIIDVIGVCTNVGDVTAFTTRAGKESFRRNLELVDETNASVRITLWGKDAETFNAPVANPVIAVKDAKVSDFGGTSLSCSFDSILVIEPTTPEGIKLRSWYDSQNGQIQAVSLSTGGGGAVGGVDYRKPLEYINFGNFGQNVEDKPTYFSARVFITFCKHDEDAKLYYPACNSQKVKEDGRACQKRAIEEGGQWSCEACDAKFSHPNYRYLLRFQVADATGSRWVSLFNDEAEQLMGISASQLHHIRETDPARFASYFEALYFKQHIFNLRVKGEYYQDAVNVKCTVGRIYPMDEVKETKWILEDIKRIRAAKGM